jgi:hypothetical protein
MKINYINKLKMGQVTLGCLQDEDNALLYEGVIAIEEGVEELGKTLDGIVAFSQKQTARTGYAAEKKGRKTNLAEAAWFACCGLQSLASQTDNNKLAAQVKFARSAFFRGRENIFVNRCKFIATLGGENAALLSEKYNVKPADLAALNEAITAFEAVQGKPRNGKAAQASATAELKRLFAELDKTLNEQLDPLIEKFKKTNTAFYNEYRTARSIVDSAASHQGKVVEASAPTELPKAA